MLDRSSPSRRILVDNFAALTLYKTPMSTAEDLPQTEMRMSPLSDHDGLLRSQENAVSTGRNVQQFKTTSHIYDKSSSVVDQTKQNSDIFPNFDGDFTRDGQVEGEEYKRGDTSANEPISTGGLSFETCVDDEELSSDDDDDFDLTGYMPNNKVVNPGEYLALQRRYSFNCVSEREILNHPDEARSQSMSSMYPIRRGNTLHHLVFAPSELELKPDQSRNNNKRAIEDVDGPSFREQPSQKRIDRSSDEASNKLRELQNTVESLEHQLNTPGRRERRTYLLNRHKLLSSSSEAASRKLVEIQSLIETYEDDLATDVEVEERRRYLDLRRQKLEHGTPRIWRKSIEARRGCVRLRKFYMNEHGGYRLIRGPPSTRTFFRSPLDPEEVPDELAAAALGSKWSPNSSDADNSDDQVDMSVGIEQTTIILKPTPKRSPPPHRSITPTPGLDNLDSAELDDFFSLNLPSRTPKRSAPVEQPIETTRLVNSPSGIGSRINWAEEEDEAINGPLPDRPSISLPGIGRGINWAEEEEDIVNGPSGAANTQTSSGLPSSPLLPSASATASVQGPERSSSSFIDMPSSPPQPNLTASPNAQTAAGQQAGTDQNNSSGQDALHDVSSSRDNNGGTPQSPRGIVGAAGSVPGDYDPGDDGSDDDSDSDKGDRRSRRRMRRQNSDSENSDTEEEGVPDAGDNTAPSEDDLNINVIRQSWIEDNEHIASFVQQIGGTKQDSIQSLAAQLHERMELDQDYGSKFHREDLENAPHLANFVEAFTASEEYTSFVQSHPRAKDDLLENSEHGVSADSVTQANVPDGPAEIEAVQTLEEQLKTLTRAKDDLDIELKALRQKHEDLRQKSNLEIRQLNSKLQTPQCNRSAHNKYITVVRKLDEMERESKRPATRCTWPVPHCSSKECKLKDAGLARLKAPRCDMEEHLDLEHQIRKLKAEYHSLDFKYNLIRLWPFRSSAKKATPISSPTVSGGFIVTSPKTSPVSTDTNGDDSSEKGENTERPLRADGQTNAGPTRDPLTQSAQNEVHQDPQHEYGSGLQDLKNEYQAQLDSLRSQLYVALNDREEAEEEVRHLKLGTKSFCNISSHYWEGRDTTGSLLNGPVLAYDSDLDSPDEISSPIPASAPFDQRQRDLLISNKVSLEHLELLRSLKKARDEERDAPWTSHFRVVARERIKLLSSKLINRKLFRFLEDEVLDNLKSFAPKSPDIAAINRIRELDEQIAIRKATVAEPLHLPEEEQQALPFSSCSLPRPPASVNPRAQDSAGTGSPEPLRPRVSAPQGQGKIPRAPPPAPLTKEDFLVNDPLHRPLKRMIPEERVNRDWWLEREQAMARDELVTHRMLLDPVPPERREEFFGYRRDFRVIQLEEANRIYEELDLYVRPETDAFKDPDVIQRNKMIQELKAMIYSEETLEKLFQTCDQEVGRLKQGPRTTGLVQKYFESLEKEFESAWPRMYWALESFKRAARDKKPAREDLAAPAQEAQDRNFEALRGSLKTGLSVDYFRDVLDLEQQVYDAAQEHNINIHLIGPGYNWTIQMYKKEQIEARPPSSENAAELRVINRAMSTLKFRDERNVQQERQMREEHRRLLDEFGITDEQVERDMREHAGSYDNVL